MVEAVAAPDGCDVRTDTHMTLKTRLSVLLLSTPVLAFVVVGGLMGNASARSGDDTFQHLRVFDDVAAATS